MTLFDVDCWEILMLSYSNTSIDGLPHEDIEQSPVQRLIDLYQPTFSNISAVKLSLADTAYRALHLHNTANS